MSELTRDEIQRACEAVGWGTVDVPGGLVVRSPDGGFGWLALRRSKLHALALLEATGEDFTVFRIHSGPYSGYAVGWVGDPGPMKPSPTLPEAAVRAVLAWAEWKEAKG